MFICFINKFSSIHIFIQLVLHSLESETAFTIFIKISLERKYFNMYIIIFILVVIINSLVPAQYYGSWYEIDSMNIARVGHAMVVLPNGDVLVSGSEADSIQSSAEIYEFSTGKWRYTTPMNVPRGLHNLVLLSSGKVIAIGGYKEQSCELFDPQTETWSMTDSIPTFRFTGQTVTELADGRIMVAGGYYVDTATWDFIILNKVDIYDPATETWLQAEPMDLARYEHSATLLNDGRVLVAGGNTETFQTADCEIYNPLNNTWTNTSPMTEPRYSHAAIRLSNGNVFISGGDPSSGYTCEVFDVNNYQWRYASNMMGYRAAHKIYYLSKIDKLLILGGDALPPSTEDTWEIFDPNALASLYYESFPINQFLFDNNVQLLSGNIMVAGAEEYNLYPLPNTWPSKRCWISDVSTEVNESNTLLKSYKLDQNFPNPFNAQTTIGYELPAVTTVKLVIYDVLGKEVETLVNQVQNSGSYSVNFDAKDLPSGIYYYRLSTKETEKNNGNTFQQTKKMILLR